MCLIYKELLKHAKLSDFVEAPRDVALDLEHLAQKK